MMNIKKFEDFVKETAYSNIGAVGMTGTAGPIGMTGSSYVSGMTGSPIISKDKYRDIRLNEILFVPAI